MIDTADTVSGPPMSFYARRILPWLITKSCATKPVRKQREKVVPLASGRVLEIGAGGGLNLPFYDRSKISEVLGLDISDPLLEQAQAQAKASGVPFVPIKLDAADIPLERNEVDTVLVTYSLCSIDDLGRALGEMRRVLKPSGRLIFCEHGAAPDASVRRVQNALTPVWRRVAGGCRLNRDLPAEIASAGFKIEWLENMYLPGTPRFTGWNSWGVAETGNA
jgi:ubiquinone/menaquinone biosynthesis C-methylase UbiE